MVARSSTASLLPLVEAGAVLLPTLAFICIYVDTDPSALAAVGPHLSLIAATWACVVLARLLGNRLLSSRCAAALSVVATSTVWLALAAYYTLAAVGLKSWGRIITWPIIKPYVWDVPGLFQYLEVSASQTALASIILAGGTIVIWWFIAGRRDWTRRLSNSLRPRTFWILLVGIAAALGIQAAAFFNNPPTYAAEPISLTFFPPPPVQFGQSQWRQDPAQLAREDDARRLLKSAQPQRRPVVVMFVSDALRADRMSLFGHSRTTTPNLQQRFAQSAAGTPMRALAACAETSCAMPALLYAKTPRRMTAGALGLSEALKILGYRSYILLSGDHTNYYGLGQLYQPADIYSDATTQRDRFVNDDRMVLDAVRQLPEFDAAQPTFIQIHLLSNHPLGMRWPTSTWYQPSENYARWARGNKSADLTSKQRELARNYYDNGLRQMDRMIDLVLSELARRKYLDEAFVIVSGDHGEMLGEHGMLSHAAGVYQPVLEVPAVFLRYGYDAANLQTRPLVAQTDIAPTILAELGVPVPATWEGVPLQELDNREFLTFEQGNQVGMVFTTGRYQGYKYWLDLQSNGEYVFDLASDPDEVRNLIADIPIRERQHWRYQVLKRLESG